MEKPNTAIGLGQNDAFGVTIVRNCRTMRRLVIVKDVGELMRVLHTSRSKSTL